MYKNCIFRELTKPKRECIKKCVEEVQYHLGGTKNVITEKKRQTKRASHNYKIMPTFENFMKNRMYLIVLKLKGRVAGEASALI